MKQKRWRIFLAAAAVGGGGEGEKGGCGRGRAPRALRFRPKERSWSSDGLVVAE